MTKEHVPAPPLAQVFPPGRCGGETWVKLNNGNKYNRKKTNLISKFSLSLKHEQ